MSHLNIPPIRIPSPTEYDVTAVASVASVVYAPSNALATLHFPLLGSPRLQCMQRQQRTQKVFTFPSPVPCAATAATTATTVDTELAASVLLSIAQSSPVAPNKCRRITTTFLDYCRVCEISLLHVARGIYADVCKSCEDIQHAHRQGTSMPACFLCYSDAYHIHRNCKQPICKRCLHYYTLCPSCKVLIEKQ